MKKTLLLLTASVLLFSGCALDEPTGAAGYNFTSLDVRGQIFITEIHWAGSVDNAGAKSDPDDDFIEIKSILAGPIDLGGWGIVFSGSFNHRFVFPAGTVLESGGRFVVGTRTNGAFTAHDFVDPALKIPAYGWAVSVQDGGGKVSDSADFSGRSWLPAGMALPEIRRSMVREEDAFQSGEPGDQYDSWTTYGSHDSWWSAGRISTDYRSAVYCSPSTW